MLQRALGARGAMAACAPGSRQPPAQRDGLFVAGLGLRTLCPRRPSLAGHDNGRTRAVARSELAGAPHCEHSCRSSRFLSGRRIESALYDEEGEATCGSRSARERATRGRSRLRRSGSSSGARRGAISCSRTTRSPASMPPSPSTQRATSSSRISGRPTGPTSTAGGSRNRRTSARTTSCASASPR